MFLRFQAMKERKESGFTLIELLVVILIIAILAAIAIPVFLNQRKKGWVSQSQSALKNAATALETYATEQNGSYAGANNWTHANLTTYGYSDIAVVDLTITADSEGYCISADHTNFTTNDADEVWTYDSDAGVPVTTNTCTL